MPTQCFGGWRGRFAVLWPWLVLVALVVPAVWHVVDFPDDRDAEFPGVSRPTFSRRPPPAYRLAEPGDTIDRIAIYASAVGVVLALVGLKRRWGGARAHSLSEPEPLTCPPGTLSRRERGGSRWLAALGVAFAAYWHSVTPGPTFDGWHGLGWRSISDHDAPTVLRISLASAALGFASLVAVSLWIARRGRVGEECRWRSPGVSALLTAAVVLAASRQFEIPGVEPAGYWPRWAWVWGLAAFDMALIRAMTPLCGRSRLAACGGALGGAAAWSVLVAGGIWLTWYHRPLERLRVVEPGRIFMSAMPTARGLAVAHGRHRFKTIINLFPENPPLRHPLHPDEVRFAREHGIRYVESPGGVASSDAFLDETLRLARDPESWPILVHCHGCMDRTPAWMGIYRFVVQGRPLAEILTEIERHRGYRPKASVTLLYNRVLSPRAPERYAADPTASLLRACAEGTRDPYEDQLRAEIPGREPPRRTSCLPGRGPARSLTELDARAAIARVPIDLRPLAPTPLGLLSMTPRIDLSAASRRTTPPAISSLMQTALANPGLISLAAGFVDQDSLPVEATARAVAAILGDPIEGRRALQYGTTRGDAGLRRHLVAQLERNEGVPVGTFHHVASRMVVTTGSAQLLYLVAEALLDPGDIVLVESPTYFVFLGVLETRGARAIGIETDSDGLRLDALEETLADLEAQGLLDRVKLIYTVTEHANPTGNSLAEGRRGPLVELARRWSKEGRIFILEDAAYRGLSFAEVEPPSIWSHDDEPGDTVILARTFSKTLSPGLKTGYGILPESLVDPVLRLKGNHDFGTSNFNQRILEHLLADGSYDRHVEGLVALYRRKRDVMLGALERHFAALEDVSWTRPSGGLFVWLSAPEGVDTGPEGPLFARCLAEGVLYVPGAFAFAETPGPTPTRHARLCFGVPCEADLDEGARRLAAAMTACLDPVA